MRGAGTRGDQRGVALPSAVVVASLGAVLVAGAAFLVTGPDRAPSDTAAPATAVATSPAPSPTATAPRRKIRAKQPAVVRGDVYVEVYNNSGISGLAGATATRLSDAGWNVVGSDNWYGTIPDNTVYYPERLEAAARLLAKDLGVTRLKPAISPMRFDRLTVILTAGLA